MIDIEQYSVNLTNWMTLPKKQGDISDEILNMEKYCILKTCNV